MRTIRLPFPWREQGRVALCWIDGPTVIFSWRGTIYLADRHGLGRV